MASSQRPQRRSGRRFLGEDQSKPRKGDHAAANTPATDAVSAGSVPAPVTIRPPAPSNDDADDEFAPDTDESLLTDDLLAAAQQPAARGDPDVSTSEGPTHRRILVRRELRQRVDVYLQNRLKGISRSRIQKLIDLGGVTINDKAPKASTQIRPGDVIDVILPPQGVRAITPEPIPLEVLHENEHFIVINKQANLIVHPARGYTSGTLLNALAYRMKQQVEAAGGVFKERQTRGFVGDRVVTQTGEVPGLSGVGAKEFRPGIIHRLDKNTTGVIVLAKSDEAHWGIARQFEDRTTLKAYLALVHGNLDTHGGAIDQPIGRHPTIREAMAVRHDSLSKRALTLFRVREQYRGFSLVELELKTGRTHQIRVHMAYIGHPIVGDILYGGEALFRGDLDNPPQVAGRHRFVPWARDKATGQKLEADALARKDLIIAHPALHAALLQFVHPVTRQTARFTAPLHEPVLALVRELRVRPSDGPVTQDGTWIDLAQAVPAA